MTDFYMKRNTRLKWVNMGESEIIPPVIKQIDFSFNDLIKMK